MTRATFSTRDDLLQCLRWLKPDGVLIAYRSEALPISDTEIHRYSIGGESRVLQVVRAGMA